MSNVDFSDLSELECPILEQPLETDCLGDLIRKLAYNTALFERALLSQVKPAGLVQWSICPLVNKPKGFILADGSWYSPEVYPELFKCIAYRYGRRADGCFRIPDLRSVSIRGQDLGRKCLSDIDTWTGFTAEGGVTYGDNVGAQQTYCKDETTPSTDCVLEKEILLTPLISTGEICI